MQADQPDRYPELPRELTRLLKEPDIYLPGEMATLDEVATWVTADGTITRPGSDT